MRYGAFRYGDGTKYGEGLHESQLWAVFIDWDGDGIFSVENEASRMTGLRALRGRKHPLKSDGKGFELVDIGRLIIQLNNSDGRYNTFNTKSPIYPLVRPGVNIKVQTKLPGSGTLCDVFAGKIDDIVPVSGINERVEIIAVDGLKWLDGQGVVLHTQENKSLNQLIDVTLAESAWPWGSDLETSTDIIPWFWAPTDKKARQLLHELASAYLGVFFVGADGAANFYTRNHDFATSILRLDQDQLSTEIQTRSPWDVIKNNISVTCRPRKNAGEMIIWTLNDKPFIPAGATIDIWGTYNVNGEEVPIQYYITPTPVTDFTLNTAADGTGTNITASATIVNTVYANKVHFQITNGSATDGNITFFQLRGFPLLASLSSIILTDDASKTLYGPKSLQIDSLFLQNSNLINDLANALLLLLKDPQSYPTIKIINRPDLQYTVDLFDNIDLIVEKLGIADTFRIGYIEHEWMTETGQASQTIFTLEPVNNSLTTVWEFPTQIGIDSIFTF